MRDFYQDGFNDGYGKPSYGEREYPQNSGDDYSYRRGMEDGIRRRQYSYEDE